MAGNKSAGSSTARNGEEGVLRPSTTPEDVLAMLKKQGITDLTSLATVLLAKVREATADDDAPGGTLDYIIYDHYVLIRETVAE
jgi:hypothetical protein